MTYILILTLIGYQDDSVAVAEFSTLEACREVGSAWIRDMEKIGSWRQFRHHRPFVCRKK